MKALLRTATLLILSLTALPALAQSITHFSQPVGKHVSLVLAVDGSTTCPFSRTFFERFPSGDLSSEAFRVPGNQLLIVTSFSWVVVGTPQRFLSGGATEAAIQSGFGNQPLRTMHTAPAVNVTPELANGLRIGGTSNIPSGVRIGSGRYLCALGSSRIISTNSRHTVAAAEINGYLLKK